jgi:hypothetical protein
MEENQKATDIADLKTLMAKYCHGIDKKNEVLFMSIWDKNGVYDLPRGHGEGTEGINQLVHKVWTQVPRCHHHITNPLIEVNGDSASAVSDVIYFRQTEDGLWQFLSGMYDFEFVKRSGVWYIKLLKFSSFINTSPIFKENIKG